MSGHTCDVCGKPPATRVIYGYPSPELIEEAQRGEVILGGCSIEVGQPRWLCERCASSSRDSVEFPDEDS